MENFVLRVFWAGLVLSPVIPALVAPGGAALPVFALVASGGGSAAALVAALHRRGNHSGGNARLLRRSALRTPPPDLPDARTRRDMVAVALRAATVSDAGVPPDHKSAIARIVLRVIQERGCSGPGDISDNTTTELVLLLRLLRAKPGEAGALAQLFQHPDVVLDLRDEVMAVMHRRAAYDRDFAALEATQALWSAGRTRFDSLRSALAALGTPDQDLWHRVVLHDGAGAAALWCVSQPTCDRATIAAFMQAVVRQDALFAALDRGDQNYLETVQAVLKRWNVGGYGLSEIAYQPEAGDPDWAKALSAAFDRLAEQTGKQRLPDPCGLFSPVQGRAPRDRSHWDLEEARLVSPPDASAYLDAHLF